MNDFWVSVVTSLIATGIGAIVAWILSQRRQVHKIKNEIEGINNKVKNINDQMVNSFTQVNNRFDEINNRFDRVDNEKNALVFEFSKLTDVQKGLDERVESMKTEFTSTLLETVVDVVRDDENQKRSALGKAYKRRLF